MSLYLLTISVTISCITRTRRQFANTLGGIGKAGGYWRIIMTRISSKLGQSMSAYQVAAYLNIDVKTARKYYRELGGIRIGRRYKFFEEEVYNAVQERRIEEQQEENCLDRAGTEGGQKERKALQDKERGGSVGSEDERSVKRRLARIDNHGLFG
jgi:hypothetical protein